MAENIFRTEEVSLNATVKEVQEGYKRNVYCLPMKDLFVIVFAEYNERSKDKVVAVLKAISLNNSATSLKVQTQNLNKTENLPAQDGD